MFAKTAASMAFICASKKTDKYQFIEQSSTLLLLAFTSILLPLVTLWKIRFLVLIRKYLKLSTLFSKIPVAHGF